MCCFHGWATQRAAKVRAAASQQEQPRRELAAAILRTDTCSNTSLIFLMATRSPAEPSERAIRRRSEREKRAGRVIDGGAYDAVAASADHLQDSVAAAFTVLGEESCSIA